MKKNRVLSIVIWMGIYFWSISILLAADFTSAMNSLAETLVPKLGHKKVTIGLILEQKTHTRFQLSEVLTDEISIALQNKGVNVLISEKDSRQLKKEWIRMMDSAYREDAAEKIGNLLGADTIGIGTFHKWGKDYRVSLQMIDSITGKVVTGSTVKIDGDSIPSDMMKPVLERVAGAIVFKGVGQASISHQCSDEAQKSNTCPPHSELQRRALEVAKLFAIQQIVEQSGVNAFSMQRVLSGRLQPGQVKTQSGHQLVRLEYGDPAEQDDRITIELIAEIKE